MACGSFLAAGAQILFKVMSPGGYWELCSAKGLLALFMYGVSFLLFFYALKKVPLNLAYQFTVLTYILICVGCHFILGEQIVYRQLLGIAVVAGGLALILF